MGLVIVFLYNIVLMNNRISFKLSKLIKQYGFNDNCKFRYNEQGILTATKLGMHQKPNNFSDSYSAAMLIDVIEWMKQRFGIKIMSQKNSDNNWYFLIQADSFDGILKSKTRFDLKNEALEAGVYFSLKAFSDHV